ncbi:hypothetical protein [uncultured Methylobacterium sp.]|uniref:hypothetical protein n=1 Tax=uncultured Methylobacterium sp. TaxID=157278 RepID=UPI0035CC238E
MMVTPLEMDGAVVAMMVVPAGVTVAMPSASMAKAVAAVVITVALTTVILCRGRHGGEHERGGNQSCKTHLHRGDLSTFRKPSFGASALNGH